MNSEHNPSIHWGWGSHPLAGSTIHNQELCHQAKSHYHAWWRAATPFLTSACTAPPLQFSRGKVWIQVCLLCLELSSCSVSSDILCPALHWPGTCAAQMPGTAFIRGPHSGCCSAPPPVLSVKDCHTFVLSMAPHLSVDTFCKSQDFAFVFHIRGVILQTRGWVPDYSHCLLWKTKLCCLLSCKAGNFCSGSSATLFWISNLWILYCLIKRKLLVIE